MNDYIETWAIFLPIYILGAVAMALAAAYVYARTLGANFKRAFWLGVFIWVPVMVIWLTVILVFANTTQS